jgi:hypothetical protein
MCSAGWALLNFMVRPLIKSLAAGILMCLVGLVHRDLVHCSRLDPTHPLALSNYLEARGFPSAWLTTDNGTCGTLPGVPGRVLWSELGFSVVFWFVAAAIAVALLPRLMRRSRQPSLILAAALLLGSLAKQPMAQRLTLTEALTQQGVTDITQLPQGLSNLTVIGPAVDADQRDVIAAFFDSKGTLHVAQLDRLSSRWQHAMVDLGDGRAMGNSIVNLTHTPGFIYVASHINPSAERLIVLSRNLKVVRALSGWKLAMLPDETVVYHRSQIHFAPTHSLEISVFNPVTRIEKQIYPPKPYQAVRKAFIDRVARAYEERGEAWFSRYNHHMNPELFDSTLEGEVTLDPAARSLSFRVRFGDRDNTRDPLAFSERVAVTCGPTDRIDRLQCRERLQ